MKAAELGNEDVSASVGASIEEKAQVGVEVEDSSIRVRGGRPLQAINARTHPYPGFPTDIQAQFMALMTLSRGQSIIMETVFENRFMHVAELKTQTCWIYSLYRPWEITIGPVLIPGLY